MLETVGAQWTEGTQTTEGTSTSVGASALIVTPVMYKQQRDSRHSRDISNLRK